VHDRAAAAGCPVNRLRYSAACRPCFLARSLGLSENAASFAANESSTFRLDPNTFRSFADTAYFVAQPAL